MWFVCLLVNNIATTDFLARKKQPVLDMGKGQRKKGTPVAWNFELTPKGSTSDSGPGQRKPGRTWAPVGHSSTPDAAPLDEDTLCALAPGVPRGKVRALAAISGSDVQGLVDRLLALSASLGDSASAEYEPSELDPLEPQLCFTDSTTFFSRIPSELLGPLLASLPLAALGSFSLTCREANALATAYLRSELVSVVPRQLRGWSARRVVGLLRAAKGLRHLELDAQGDRGCVPFLDAHEMPIVRRVVLIRRAWFSAVINQQDQSGRPTACLSAGDMRRGLFSPSTRPVG